MVKDKDIETKAFLLEYDLDKRFASARRHAIRGDERDMIDFKLDFGDDGYRVAKNLLNAQCDKKKRVREKVSKMVLSGNCVFLTLTFTDKTLKETSKETRRRYVARYLKSQSPYYVANIDFGDKKGREHYHALAYGRVDPAPWHDYGAIKILPVHKSEKDMKKVSAYVAKLSRHALKKSTHDKKGASCPRLIYSRKTFA